MATPADCSGLREGLDSGYVTRDMSVLGINETAPAHREGGYQGSHQTGGHHGGGGGGYSTSQADTGSYGSGHQGGGSGYGSGQAGTGGYGGSGSDGGYTDTGAGAGSGVGGKSATAIGGALGPAGALLLLPAGRL